MSQSAPEDRVNKPVSDYQYLRRLLPYLLRQRGGIWTAAVLYPCNALCGVLPPFLLQQMLDRGIARGDMHMLWWLAGAYLASLIIEFVSGFFSEYVVSALGQRAMAEVRHDLFAHVQKLPIAFFSHTPIGRLLTRMTSDVEALSEIFATGAITIISDILAVLAVVGMMLFLSVKLTLASLLLVPVLVLCAQGFQRYARRAFQEIRRHIARINAFLAEHIGAMSMVQAFNQEVRTEREFWHLNEAYRDANHRAVFADAALYALVEAIGTCAVAATIAYGARDLASGSITAGVLVAFMQYIRRFFVPIRDLSTKYTVLQSAFAAAERIFSLLEEPVTLTEAVDAKPVADFAEDIVFDHVGFTFGDPSAADAEWILHDIVLRVRKGERIGLVGATGSGKTTLLKLINRSYDVQRGAVRIDGTDVRALQLAPLRRLFAAVLQDASLFRGTIRENLMVASRIKEEQMLQAVQTAQAQALVDGLPQQLETDVGNQGENLSAGERQVLALARAIALNAPILLMDEATSHVDTPTEARIQAAIDAMLTGRTAIIVAHRLSTIKKVDRVIVLAKGRIVQEGPPDQLLRQGGPFRAFVEQSEKPEQADSDA